MCAAGIAAAALMGCSGAETAGKNETKAAAEVAAGESAESLSSEETKRKKIRKSSQRLSFQNSAASAGHPPMRQSSWDILRKRDWT